MRLDFNEYMSLCSASSQGPHALWSWTVRYLLAPGEPVVMELYEDLLPSSARESRVRCSGAGTGRLGDVNDENDDANFRRAARSGGVCVTCQSAVETVP